MKRMTAKQFAYFLIGAIALICILSATSCRTWKTTGRVTRDSVVLKTKDTTIYKYVTKTRDSIVIKDTSIGFSAEDFGFEIDHNSTSDTVIKKGKLTIRRTVNNGKEYIHCNTDSFTILVANLRSAILYQENHIAQQNTKISELTKSHDEVVTKEKQPSWFMRAFAWLRNGFAILGLVVFIIWLIKRFL